MAADIAAIKDRMHADLTQRLEQGRDQMHKGLTQEKYIEGYLRIAGDFIVDTLAGVLAKAPARPNISGANVVQEQIAEIEAMKDDRDFFKTPLGKLFFEFEGALYVHGSMASRSSRDPHKMLAESNYAEIRKRFLNALKRLNTKGTA